MRIYRYFSSRDVKQPLAFHKDFKNRAFQLLKLNFTQLHIFHIFYSNAKLSLEYCKLSLLKVFESTYKMILIPQKYHIQQCKNQFFKIYLKNPNRYLYV